MLFNKLLTIVVVRTMADRMFSIFFILIMFVGLLLTRGLSDYSTQSHFDFVKTVFDAKTPLFQSLYPRCP